MISTKKALSIQINLNGLSFCILNKSDQSIEHLHEVDFEKPLTPHELLPHLKAELGSKTIFSQDFNEVVVVHQNELSSLVPEDLFDEKNSADYLKYNSKILKSDYIANDSISLARAKNVYVPYVNINNYIFDTFGQFVYKHSITVFAETLLKLKRVDHSKKVFINVNTNSFEMVVLQNNELLLTNVHQYYTKEDLLYFVLFTYEQMGLDTDTDELILSGRIERNDELYECLYTYIRTISFISGAPDYKMSKDTPVDNSRYFLILNSF